MDSIKASGKNDMKKFSMAEEIQTHLQESIAVKQSFVTDPLVSSQIQQLVEACVKSINTGGKILLAGNGGSFSDAQHLSAEFVSRFQFDRAPLPSLVLGANSSAISAIGNDYGYEEVFARELIAVSSPSDVFIPITTSGNSPNIIAATKAAIDKGLEVMGLTGANHGNILELCECISVPSKSTARIQECHILIGHIVCALVESTIFPQKK